MLKTLILAALTLSAVAQAQQVVGVGKDTDPGMAEVRAHAVAENICNQDGKRSEFVSVSLNYVDAEKTYVAVMVVDCKR
jgi:hypothetical protein